MEKNNEINLNSWVAQRLAALRPDNAWQPNASKGLSRLRQLGASRSERSRKWKWVAATATAAAVTTSVLMAAPAPRVLAQRCLDCSVALWQSLSPSGPVQAVVKPESTRKPAPDFMLTDASGNPVKLSDSKGKVVLLNFWATWCGGCQVEIPWFIDFQNKYKDAGLAVIGVSMDDDGWKSVRPYLKEKNVNYPIVIGNEALAKQYAVEAMPVTLLIDREGKIAATHVGLVTKTDYQTEIETLLHQSVAASTSGSSN